MVEIKDGVEDDSRWEIGRGKSARSLNAVKRVLRERKACNGLE